MEKKLQRNTYDQVIAGVASGLADYFNVEVSWIRLAFVLAFLLGFSGILAYIILWIAMPKREYPLEHVTADYRVDRNNSKTSNSRLVFGFILVALGVYFLSNEFDLIPYWLSLHKLWPAILIIIGILILTKTGKKNYPENKKNVDWDKKEADYRVNDDPNTFNEEKL